MAHDNTTQLTETPDTVRSRHDNVANGKSDPIKLELEHTSLISWKACVVFGILHLAAFYGLYLSITVAKWGTVLFVPIMISVGGFGITAGAHRLWAHKAYKATWQLRLLLCFLNTVAMQNTIYYWARNHRSHHKYMDTDADPHNVGRGLFYAHIGWLLVPRHTDVARKGDRLDLSDLKADPIVMFQKKHMTILGIMFAVILPTLIPWYFWGESLYVSWFAGNVLRFAISLHGTFSVNSAAHRWGTKAYDKSITPVNNFSVAILVNGEGWHNYHHVFPWDYKAAELGNYRANLTTAFIDFFAKIGWAYDLKSVSPEMVKKRSLRSGDASHLNCNGKTQVHDDYLGGEKPLWGWDDQDMPREDLLDTDIFHKKE